MESLYQLIHRSLTPEGILPGRISVCRNRMGTRFILQTELWTESRFFTPLPGEADTGCWSRRWAANRDRMEEAQGLVLEFCETGHMIRDIDGIQQYIIDRREELAAGKIFRLGEELMFGGTHRRQ